MEIRAERIPGTRAKRLNPEGWLHYNIRVYVEPDASTKLEDVEMVVYILDPSFEDGRYVVSVDRGNQFQIEIWTYDSFDAEAKVLTRPGTYQTVKGVVEWEGRVEAKEYA